jgi:hypothetical protein
VIPALQRFYGGAPQDWMQVPLVLLNAFAVAMPRLQAQESLLMTEVVAMGMGNLEKSDARRLQERWRELALGASARPGPPSAEFLASKGIGFKREYAKG